MSDIKIERVDFERAERNLDDDSYTKMTEAGPVIDLTVCRAYPSPSCGSWLPGKHEWLDYRTGEVKPIQAHERRVDDLKELRRTFQRIRWLVNANVRPGCALWLTLTYGENMQDTKRLYTDFKKFWQKFKRWCEKQPFAVPEYIAVVEPQGRGAWHIHAFLIWETKAPFISNDEVIERLWTHGYTKTRSVSNVDNVGAYFSAYLADVPLEQYKDASDKGVRSDHIKSIDFPDGTAKKIVKGGRVAWYPAGMNIVRTSRGIKQPNVSVMTYSEAQKKVSDATKTFERIYRVSSNDERDTTINIILKQQYNTLRKSPSITSEPVEGSQASPGV